MSEEYAAELAKIRVQQRALSERAGWLLKRLSCPTVDPVLIYYRYGAREEEPACAIGYDEDRLRSAYVDLFYGNREGRLSPVGVTVGGAFISFGELARRYPDLENDG
jgi:hypothetical protein